MLSERRVFRLEMLILLIYCINNGVVGHPNTGVCDATNILRFVLDSICFLQGYLNNPINNIKIALPTDHVSHMAKRTHL